MTMISFKVEDGRFNYRSAAVILCDGHVLVHRARADDFWALPGGRVEFMECADQAVVREIGEELGWNVRVARQLWHVENFFEYRSERFHELLSIFRVDLVSPVKVDSEVDFQGIEDADDDILFRWVPVDCVAGYTLKPDFLKSRFKTLPQQVEYVQLHD